MKGNTMGKVIAVCTSSKKGVQKHNQETIQLLVGHGIKGDAHAGKWHRQVSLLSYEKIQAFKARGADINDGAFGENIVVSGIDLSTLPVGTLLKSGNVTLKVTQIGKECHHHCAIYHAVGDCIMPREGIFAEVLSEGTIKNGDTIQVL